MTGERMQLSSEKIMWRVNSRVGQQQRSDQCYRERLVNTVKSFKLGQYLFLTGEPSRFVLLVTDSMQCSCANFRRGYPFLTETTIDGTYAVHLQAIRWELLYWKLRVRILWPLVALLIRYLYSVIAPVVMNPWEGSNWGLNKPKLVDPARQGHKVAGKWEGGIDMTDVSRRCLTTIELQISSQQNLYAFQ